MPDPGFAGTDSYTYEVCDLAGACDTAEVTITVQGASPSVTPAPTPPPTGGPPLAGTGADGVVPGLMAMVSLAALGLVVLGAAGRRGRRPRTLRHRSVR
jgi:hypothetical protein